MKRVARVADTLQVRQVSVERQLPGILDQDIGVTHDRRRRPRKRPLGGVLEAVRQRRAAVRARLGLEDPLPVQFIHYLRDLLHFDLGTSFTTGQSVASDLWDRLPATLELGFVGLALGIAVVGGEPRQVVGGAGGLLGGDRVRPALSRSDARGDAAPACPHTVNFREQRNVPVPK